MTNLNESADNPIGSVSPQNAPEQPLGVSGGHLSIPQLYSVKPIATSQTKEWFMKKHYAHRLPCTSFAFGIYDQQKVLQGVCSFGLPPNYRECEAWQPYDLLELNRLVVNDGLERGVLSYFVGQCLKLLPKPRVLISYADTDKGHHGYIYQATNWIYTGIGGGGCHIYITRDGEERHQRSVDIGDGGVLKAKLKADGVIIDEVITTGKARYYYFIGNKKEKAEMKKMLRFPILPYPKGDNIKYDASYSPTTQGLLF